VRSAGALALLALGTAGACTPVPAATERTIHVTIRFSRFEPAHVRVAPGEVVRFVVDNADPIDHEFILGDDRTHRIHEAGTEPSHAPRPGEVSIPPGATRATSYAFAAQPGTTTFACHLPGHLAYGMRGTVSIGG
jgi:uncharacterized cupredoxin-like copper-binding protein